MRRLRIAAALLMLWASSVQAVAQDAGPGHAAAAPTPPPGQRSAVLVIFGDDASQPWIQPMSDGISRVLYGRGAESPEAYYEYLDAVRFPQPAHRNLFRDTIRTKYRGIHFTLVVPVAGAAIRFVDEVREELWPGVPVLFIWADRDRVVAPGALADVVTSLPAEVIGGRHGWLLTEPEEFATLLRNALVVHTMLERKRRGQAVVLPRGASLADLIPPERRSASRRPEPSVPAPDRMRR